MLQAGVPMRGPTNRSKYISGYKFENTIPLAGNLPVCFPDLAGLRCFQQLGVCFLVSFLEPSWSLLDCCFYEARFLLTCLPSRFPSWNLHGPCRIAVFWESMCLVLVFSPILAPVTYCRLTYKLSKGVFIGSHIYIYIYMHTYIYT